MPIDGFLILPVLVAISALVLLLWLMRRIRRKSRKVPDVPRLWEGRDFRCPQCGAPMDQGWVMLGKGAIWSSREAGKPGTFAHIGLALENTISMSLPPAANMAWHCASCRLLTLDHDKLVKG
ncbi:MAG: PF20097 family protein [Pseudomonadota bacterium]|nr:PF20097 family protein [Pseudomonadota bacterium]